MREKTKRGNNPSQKGIRVAKCDPLPIFGTANAAISEKVEVTEVTR